MIMDLIEQIQIINPDKLKELCCMHLSFTLDLHDDELASLLYSKNGKVKRSYFSRKLKDKSLSEMIPLTQDSISQIYQVIEYLGRDINVEHEGLFRKTGSLSRQQELKALLNAGATIDFTMGHYSIDDCASVMKNFLSDLPEPLLTEGHYSAHCQIASMMKDDIPPGDKDNVFERQLKATRLLLLLLPQDNYRLLKCLLLLLSQVKIAHKKNLMTSYNLATVFAPQILCPRKMSAEQMKEHFPCMVKVVSFLIENAMQLFEPPPELLKDVSLYLKDMQIHRGFERTNSEGVKTAIAFCERTNSNDANAVDYTKKALSELQTYIQHLPNSARKRKLIKKLQNENKNEDVEGTRRKHFRSLSVGEAIKKHLWKTSRSKEPYHKNYHHSSYDMLSTRSSSSSTSADEVAMKAKSVEALNLEQLSVTNRNGNNNNILMKNWLRASKKLKE